MPVVRSTEGVTHTTHGATFTAFANAATGAKELCTWQTRVPAGLSGVEHRITKEEILLVTEGSPRFTIDGEPSDLAPGDVLIAPAGARLKVDNPGDQDAAMWVATSRGLTATLADGTEIAPPWAQ